MESFTIIPILGRKTDVPADDLSMFQFLNDGSALTHDAGGVNFDLTRKNNACTKSKGNLQWSASANAKSVHCSGLFELDDGSNVNHIMVDGGNYFLFDSTLTPNVLEPSTSVLFATASYKIYEMERIGAYFIFTDFGDHIPYRWTHGDTNLSAFVTSGSDGDDYTFRHILTFQRRLIGLYSNQTNGDIEIRWTESWPTTAITSLTFAASAQLYIPNDDSITGGRRMGFGNCYIYCEDSIQQLAYYEDYESPFRLYTVVPTQGSVNNASIIVEGNRHFLFNKNYGFCEYRGGTVFPYGRPISDDIEQDIRDISPTYHNLIQGAYIPITNELCWTVPKDGAAYPTHLFFFNLKTGQWRIEDKEARHINVWNISNNYTWTDLIAAVGSTWDTGTSTWEDYIGSKTSTLVYSNTNGKVYMVTGDILE